MPQPLHVSASPVQSVKGRSVRERQVLWVAGLVLLCLGVIGLTGWMIQKPVLVGLMLPGFPPMVMPTALMFSTSGIAMVALAVGRTQIATALGAGVAILALLVMAQHLTGIDLGIDLQELHRWAKDGFPNPGRPSRATASCFILAGTALMVLGASKKRWRPHVVRALGLIIVLVGLGAGLGGALRLDALYPSYLLRGMSIPTTFGMLVIGASLTWIATEEITSSTNIRDDRRIVSIGSAMLIAIALVTGIPILFVIRSQVDQAMTAGLEAAISTDVELIDSILTLHMQRAAIISNRPNAIRTLRAVHHDPNDAGALQLLQDTLDSFRPHGFSALKVSMPDGRVVASSGRFKTSPDVVVSLDADSRSTLAWQDGYLLSSRYDIKDRDLLLATVDTQQELPKIAAAIMTAEHLGATGDLELCRRVDSVVRCFPSTARPTPIELPYTEGATDRLLMLAADGGFGIHNGHEAGGEPVMGVFAPIGHNGLFVALSVQTAELYAPLRRSMEIALGLATILVVAGSTLFRTQVRPIISELIQSRESMAQKNRELSRLHAFQRAIFEQAPDGIVVSDEGGRIIEANERIASLFGYPRDALHSMTIEDLVPERARAEHQRHRADFHQSPTSRSMGSNRMLHGRRADGGQFPIEVTLAPMTSGDAKRVIAIVKDVTEARRVEQQIRDSLKEKDVLLGEIHHRVKNNLQIVQSLLDMQVGQTSDTAITNALRDSQNRIQSMALIHQTLYQSHDFAKVDFGNFLANLIGHLQSSYQNSETIISSRADQVSLPIDRAIPCGLIVNELVTNALKHAFPDRRGGHIQVEMSLLQGVDVEVAVTDDGIGLPESFDIASVASLGMQLVHVLGEQLHAELHIQRRDPTRIAFTFPLSSSDANQAHTDQTKP